MCFFAGESYVQIPPVLLGKMSKTGHWRLAIDVSDVKEVEKVATSRGDLRSYSCAIK